MTDFKQIHAIIPVKHNSERVKSKNFRGFHDGKSLLEIKIDQIRKSGLCEKIYISSNSPDAERMAGELEVGFVRRDDALCNNIVPWSDVVVGILEGMPIPNEAGVLWCHVTSPLFSNFEGMVNALKGQSEFDSVATVTPYKHFFLNPDHIPINFRIGPWHAYTQNTKPLYLLNFAAFLARKSTMIKNRYVFGDNPHFFNVSHLEGQDIDTIEEFEIASQLYKRQMTAVAE